MTKYVGTGGLAPAQLFSRCLTALQDFGGLVQRIGLGTMLPWDGGESEGTPEKVPGTRTIAKYELIIPYELQRPPALG